MRLVPLETPRPAHSIGRYGIERRRHGELNRAWVVEEPYDIAVGDRSPAGDLAEFGSTFRGTADQAGAFLEIIDTQR